MEKICFVFTLFSMQKCGEFNQLKVFFSQAVNI